MLTLKQMEALVWIVRLGSFERAAGKLNTTQSAISKRIRELEQSSGIAVFDRGRRDARLTAEGEQLFELGQEMLALQVRASSLKHDQAIPTRRLRLGVTELTALTWLPVLVSRLRAGHPLLSLEPIVDMSRSLYERLYDDALDIAVIPDTFSAAEITSVAIGGIENAWMASPSLFPSGEPITLKALTNLPFITQGNRSGSGLVVSKWLKASGAEIRDTLICDSLVAQLGLTVAGVGFSCLPRQCFEPLVVHNKLVIAACNTRPPRVGYAAMFRNDRPGAFNAYVAALCADLCDFSRAFTLPV